jgi:hypothetical protein
MIGVRGMRHKQQTQRYGFYGRIRCYVKYPQSNTLLKEMRRNGKQKIVHTAVKTILSVDMP